MYICIHMYVCVCVYIISIAQLNSKSVASCWEACLAAARAPPFRRARFVPPNSHPTRNLIPAAPGCISFHSVILDLKMKGRNKETCLHQAGVRQEQEGGGTGEEGLYAAVSQCQKVPFLWIPCSLRKQKGL
jgi:hypothetical protein